MRTLAANVAVEMPESEVDSTHYRILFLAALVFCVYLYVQHVSRNCSPTSKKEIQQLMIKKWFKTGTPWIWLNAAAVSASLIIVLGLLALIAVKGLSHFWPKQSCKRNVMQDYTNKAAS